MYVWHIVGIDADICHNVFWIVIGAFLINKNLHSFYYRSST